MRRGEQAGTRIVDDADSLLQGGVYRYGLVHDWLRGDWLHNTYIVA